MASDTDFDYGQNASQGSIADDLPACMGGVYCPDCNCFHGYCSETRALRNEAKRQGFEFYRESNSTQEAQQQMDLSKEVSGKKRPAMEQRDWIAPEDLPKKGSSKWKVDGVRDAKKNKTKILLFVDLSKGKIKRVMSLRKGFTLDNFAEELGTKTEKWVGKFVDLERGGDEGQYVNVSQ